MAHRVIDELQEVVDDVNTGVPAAQRLKFLKMVRKLTIEDLPTHETSVLAASTGLATGELFFTTAGAMMKVV